MLPKKKRERKSTKRFLKLSGLQKEMDKMCVVCVCGCGCGCDWYFSVFMSA